MNLTIKETELLLAALETTVTAYGDVFNKPTLQNYATMRKKLLNHLDTLLKHNEYKRPLVHPFID